MMEQQQKLYTLLANSLPFELTLGQSELVRKLVLFIYDMQAMPIFVLSGFAGTGKTTIISALVNLLSITKQKSVLLAPTGRAAKVISKYSQQTAFTIHKKIYTIQTKQGVQQVVRQKNYHKNTIFIVDEASMVPDDKIGVSSELFATQNLLDDLITYVFSGENCKLILSGDPAQLPPIGAILSPALDVKYLERHYSAAFFTHQLREVVRQEINSGILYNATLVRQHIHDRNYDLPYFDTQQAIDIIPITGVDLQEKLDTHFSKEGMENVVVICRSNKEANMYNQEIKKRILFQEDELSAGNLLMVVKNNYYWLASAAATGGFIANGDVVELLKVKKVEEKYGFRFADVVIRLIDYTEEKEIEVKLLLDAILMEQPSINYAQYKVLFEAVMEDYSHIPQKYKRMQQIKQDPYLNALQVKFSYALTCHKTQGGQWPVVFIIKGYVTPEMRQLDYLRWLYTALTRATQKVYLVNFEESYFAEN